MKPKMASYKWSVAEESLLISHFKNHSCLWNVHDVKYHSKFSRSLAIRKAAELFGGKFTVEQLKMKWKSMTTIFRREMSKVVQSELLGAVADDVYTPSWLHFEELRFLHGISRRRQIKGTDADAETQAQPAEEVFLEAFHEVACVMDPECSGSASSAASISELMSPTASRPPSPEISIHSRSPPPPLTAWHPCDEHAVASRRDASSVNGFLSAGVGKKKRKASDGHDTVYVEPVQVLRRPPGGATTNKQDVSLLSDNVEHFANFIASTLRSMSTSKRNKVMAALGHVIFTEMLNESDDN